jgi:hypothetical protein
MITQSELKELLNYDKETGIFIRIKSNSNRAKVNCVAGNIRKDGYLEVRVCKKSYLQHRLAWLYIYGKFPDKLIDHINGNRNDNRIENLREVDYKENTYNSKVRSDNKSGVRCVSWNKKSQSWEVRVKVDKKLKHFGSYKELDDAAKVAEKVRKEHHKEYFK